MTRPNYYYVEVQDNGFTIYSQQLVASSQVEAENIFRKMPLHAGYDLVLFQYTAGHTIMFHGVLAPGTTIEIDRRCAFVESA